MGYCSQCGVPIPDGQEICSMCYGDPFYGRDGHYLRWFEEQEEEREQKEERKREEEREQEDEH